jgi:hypothetical protein
LKSGNAQRRVTADQIVAHRLQLIVFVTGILSFENSGKTREKRNSGDCSFKQNQPSEKGVKKPLAINCKFKQIEQKKTDRKNAIAEDPHNLTINENPCDQGGSAKRGKNSTKIEQQKEINVTVLAQVYDRKRFYNPRIKNKEFRNLDWLI